MNKEITLCGYQYLLSDSGDLMNLRTKRYLTPSDNGKGYLCFNIYNGSGKVKRFMVSRLVATYFVLNPKNLPVVNHDDGIKSNNYYTNLKWDTHSGNIKHAIATGLTKKKILDSRGPIESKKVKRISLTGEEKTFKSVSSAAKEMKIDKNAISKVCLGKQITAYGYKWIYLVE